MKSLVTALIRAKHGTRWHAGTAAAAVAGAALAVLLTGGAVSAAPSVAPGPAAGIAPGSVAVGQGPSVTVLAYTATDGSVWLKNLASGDTISAGGRLTAAPSLIDVAGSPAFVIAGRGTDHQLWITSCTLASGCGSWSSLGGDITSKPGAVFQGPAVQDWSVYARGTNGALWGRTHTTAGWGPWHSLGGNLLAGTGPSAAELGGTYVLVVGTNRQMYIAEVGVTGFQAAGGLTTTSPALTLTSTAGSTPGSANIAALVGFARGTNDAGYYHRFLASSPGWHSMGGVLSAGLSASNSNTPAAPGVTSTTSTFGLGSDSRAYQINVGWGQYPPTLTGWKLIS